METSDLPGQFQTHFREGKGRCWRLEMDEEFDNFMTKVEEVDALIKQLRCRDRDVSERAKRKADLLLRSQDDKNAIPQLEVTTPEGLRCGINRTVINQKAFAKYHGTDDPAQMSKETFMAEIERDAEKRARDKLERKQRADNLKAKANDAFRKKEFERALELYNKAIDEIRDSCLLYENRALTCLRLKLYQRAVGDCNWALKLNERSIKALLYKARALSWLGDAEGAAQCMKEAEEKHPQQVDIIREYKETWEETGEE